MKFNFKIQQYQTDAVDAVVNVFNGQSFHDRNSYIRDLGKMNPSDYQMAWDLTQEEIELYDPANDAGYKNEEVELSDEQLLSNIHTLQSQNNIKLSPALIKNLGRCSLDIEMETGTGKTYVYIKRIEVKGFEIKNLRGTDSYLYLEQIVLSSKKPPMAKIELEIKYNKSINRETRILGVGDDIYFVSRKMEQYKGYIVSEIDPLYGTVTFTNGEIIKTGDIVGDISEKDMRRIQIRETILFSRLTIRLPMQNSIISEVFKRFLSYVSAHFLRFESKCISDLYAKAF